MLVWRDGIISVAALFDRATACVSHRLHRLVQVITFITNHSLRVELRSNGVLLLAQIILLLLKLNTSLPHKFQRFHFSNTGLLNLQRRLAAHVLDIASSSRLAFVASDAVRAANVNNELNLAVRHLLWLRLVVLTDELGCFLRPLSSLDMQERGKIDLRLYLHFIFLLSDLLGGNRLICTQCGSDWIGVSLVDPLLVVHR